MKEFRGTRTFKTPKEIANEWGVTRQYISLLTLSGLEKIYNNVKKIIPGINPVDAFEQMVLLFEIDDIDYFFDSFPKKIKEEIKSSRVLN